MKPIEKDELYAHLGEFLKGKGIELKEGSYTKGIHAGCSLLADAINLSQTGFERAKAGLDKKFDQVRQVIHEKTAPKAGASATGAKANSGTKATNRAAANNAQPKAPKPKSSRGGGSSTKRAPRKKT
jgi:hypothetical protein